MCLIVDANVAPQFFCGTDKHTSDLRRKVFGGGCCIVYGGKLRKEYGLIEKARRIVIALDRAGRARAVPDGPIEILTKELDQSGCLASDDPHIIALAQISGSRLLHSLDTALQKDFNNPTLISFPRGKIYKGGAKHRHLISQHCQAC